MRIPLAIGGVLVALTFGGWIAGEVGFVIYPILGAPLLAFGIVWVRGRMTPREARVPDEMEAFYATIAVTAVCIALWALAIDDLR